MSMFSRRSFLAATGAIPFSLWFEKYAAAQSPVTRYNALTVEGQAMLKMYASAVGKMMDGSATPQSSPKSWLFQWYTHAVRPDRTKASEIQRVYTAAGPNRDLAQEMWNTCQPHPTSTNPTEMFFFPWHRMYLYFFERIIRTLTDPSFTLPYWNYSDPDPKVHGIMPVQFRLKDDPNFKPLYVNDRNVTDIQRGFADVNGGEPIDKLQPGVLDLGALTRPTYLPTGPPNPGFCADVDRGLHGNVHVTVGNTTNMGRVPWAAKDPIFWLHHSNIDRLWASWAQDPCRAKTTPTNDPNWQTRPFIFADENGIRVQVFAKDFDDLAKLQYGYDKLEPVVPIACAATPLAPTLMAARTSKILTLSASPTESFLASAPSVQFAKVISDQSPAKRVYLVLRDLRADVEPGVLYYVYVELPSRTSAPEAAVHRVGVINFFGAAGHGAEHAAMPPNNDNFYSFDVTDLMHDLQKAGLINNKPKVTIAPFGKPESNAKPVVGEISFVQA